MDVVVIDYFVFLFGVWMIIEDCYDCDVLNDVKVIVEGYV